MQEIRFRSSVMGLRKAIPFLFLFLFLDSVHSEDLGHRTVMDKNGKIVLSWAAPADRGGNSVINIKVEGNGKGYIAVVFTMDGTLPESDVVMCWVKDGQTYLEDRHTDEDGVAMMDDQQDYTLINGFENDTHTVCEFSRKLDTCDTYDMVIHGGTMRIRYALSETDPDPGSPFSPTDNQGVKSVVLLKAKRSPNLDYSSLLKWEVKSANVEIPAAPLGFWCKIIKSPDLSEKNHIVSFQPMIQPGNEEYVLYIILYECLDGKPEVYDPLVASSSYECYGPNRPPAADMCKSFIMMWVNGEQGFNLPVEMGFPVGDKPRYYALNVGYSNPQQKTGIKDNSGFNVYYTPQLRDNDGGFFMIGVPHSERVVIPPNQEKYKVVGHSNPQCTNVFPEDGIHAVGVVPHAHFLGRSKTARWFRESQELKPIVNETNYDIMIQGPRMFDKDLILKKGDRFAMECYYNSKHTPNVTYGGEITTREMCVALILHYPRVAGYDASLSVPTYDTINDAFNIQVTNDKQIPDALANFDWQNADIPAIQDKMVNSPHNTQCHFGPFTEQDAANDLVTYPSPLTPYVPASTCTAYKNDSSSI